MKRLFFNLLFSCCIFISATIEAFAVSLSDFKYNTNGDYYEISSVADMLLLGEYVKENYNECFGKTFKVAVNELDFTGINYEPIGIEEYNTLNYAFQGNFDGQGVIIKNLTINDETNSYVGLFACVWKGTISNIVLDESCSIIASGKYVGGIVGKGDNAKIFQCQNHAEITNNSLSTSFSFTGGIVGELDYGTISECINYGNIRDNQRTGGIVGLNFGTVVEKCSNYGNVYSSQYYGGGIAASNQEGGVITNCLNQGDIELSSNSSSYLGSAAGIVASNYNGKIEMNKVQNCRIKVSANFAEAGAIVGSNRDILNMNYYTDDVIVTINDKEYSGNSPRGAGTTNPPKDIMSMVVDEVVYYHCAVPASYEGQDIEEIEVVSLNNLKYTNGYYEIQSASDFKTLSDYVNQGYNCKDLVFKVTVPELDFMDIKYRPMGYQYNNGVMPNERCGFSGTLEGNGVIIKNLRIEGEDLNCVGLIGYADEATISGITLDASCSIMGNGKYAGGIVAENGSLSTISNCSSNGKIYGSEQTGGICGINFGTIQNCTNSNNVIGYGNGKRGDTGGIVGSNQFDGTIMNCRNEGDISGVNNIGGIVGSNYGTVNDNRVANCTVSHSGSLVPVIGAIFGSHNTWIGIPGGGFSRNYYDNVIVSFYSRTYGEGTPCGAGGLPDPVDVERMAINGNVYYHCAVPISYEGKEIPTETTVTLDGLTYSDGVYEIRSVDDLKTLSDYVYQGNNCSGKTFHMGVSELDFGQTKSFRPIGIYSNDWENCPFSGTFDGKGVIIKNLTIENPEFKSVALFGFVKSGAISNISLEASCTITGTKYVSGIVAYIESSDILNCHNKGTIKGEAVYDSYTGGIAAESVYGQIMDCSNEGIISDGQYVGGIVGHSYAKVNNCINRGNISSSYMPNPYNGGVGGIVGDNYYGGRVTDCINYGEIRSVSIAGGITGDNTGTVSQTLISNCSNFGLVECSEGFAGGIAGSSHAGKIETVSNHGSIKGTVNIGGIVGFTQSQNSVKSSTNTGDVSGNNEVGGIVGSNNNSAISYCRVTRGVISGSNNVGAIAGTDYVGNSSTGNYNSNSYLSENYYSQNVTVICGETEYCDSTPRGIGYGITVKDVTNNNGAVLDIDNIIAGDANGNGYVESHDIVAIIRYMMTGITDGFILNNADANSDGVVNVADLVKIVTTK